MEARPNKPAPSATSESHRKRPMNIYRWDGEFSDRQEEAAFLMATWNVVLSRTRVAIAAAVIFLLASSSDFLHHGFSLVYFELLGARLAAFTVCLAPIVLFRRGHDSQVFFFGLTLGEFLVFLVAMTAHAVNGDELALVSISAFAIVAVIYFGVPNRLIYTAPVAILSSVIHVAMSYGILGASTPETAQLMLSWTALHIIGIQTIRISSQLRRSEHRTIHQYRALTTRLRREMSDRWQAEGVAQLNEENFRTVFRAAPIPLALVRPQNSRIIQANKAALDLFRIPEDKADTISLASFFGDDFKQLAAIGRDLSEQGEIELKLSSYDGDEIWAQVAGAAIRYRGGPAILLGLHDVTERRKEAEDLRLARDQATAASKSKSEFLANMSHELRTPLNAIIGFSEAIEREIFGPLGSQRYQEYAADIYESGIHLLNVINDILDLSKIEAGRFDLSEHEMDVRTVLNSASVIVKPRAQQAGVQLVIEAPDEELYLYADERALKQVLINLLANAVKFSLRGGTVQLSVETDDTHMHLKVRDEGVGMDPEDIPRALQPFTQVDGSLSRAHEGTGLGLPLAKRLVELHDGTLSIESALGEGTTVTVSLPISRLVDQPLSSEESSIIVI